MPNGPSGAGDTHAYIPQAMEQAMTQHLQQSLPSHLKQYVGQNKPAYIPQHIERELAQQMQQNMPAHLQQYSAAYLQQKMVKPGVVGMDPYHQSQAVLPSRPPIPDKLRLEHSMPAGEQFTVQPSSLPGYAPFSPDAAQQYPQNAPQGVVSPTQSFPAPGVPQPPPGPAAQPTMAYPPQEPNAAPHPPEYGFIMNPAETPPPRSWSLPGGNSQPKRLLTIFGGLVVLLVVFLVLKSLLHSGPGFTPFTAVAQDQQELIHLTDNVSGEQQQQSASTTTQNSAITTQLSLTSAQTQLLTYLSNRHAKISPKVLSLKVATGPDTQLTTAAANSTFDQTFQQLMQTQLTAYQQDLKRAYAQTTGPEGHQLLSNDYNAATLLLKQLNAGSS